jgi:glycosyltransferase involved in cell wall biosynthesis
MKILIATGVYPPALGGPAKYAKNLYEEWKKQGHHVTVKTYTKIEHALPTFVRHLYYFFKIFPAVVMCDFIYALDTFSVGLPAVCAAKIFRKKIIIRTGGDFLWEGHVERTGEKVFLKDFYNDQTMWTFKERSTFFLTKWTLRHVDALVFSTEWQRNIWLKPYELHQNTHIIENFYGSKLSSVKPLHKNFIAGGRNLKGKNLDLLKEIFREIENASLDLESVPPEQYAKKMSESYATILVSLSDISPNVILESIRYNKPFIITSETGILDRVGSCALVVDPLNKEDIRQKVLWLCNETNYAAQVEKIRTFTFTHTWEQIALEVIELYKTL